MNFIEGSARGGNKGKTEGSDLESSSGMEVLPSRFQGEHVKRGRKQRSKRRKKIRMAPAKAEGEEKRSAARRQVIKKQKPQYLQDGLR